MDDKQLLLTQLQNEADGLMKQAEADQKVMEKQSQDIEKFKRNLAKLQKENLSQQTNLRNLQKQSKAPTGANGPAGSRAQNLRNTVIGTTGLDGDDFKHSFRRSFNMTNTQNAMEMNSSKVKKDWLNDDDIEQNIKKYNEKFMETLTMQLTKQLGIDLKKTKEEAEN